MALRGKPGMRFPITKLFAVNLIGLLAACGENQAPSFTEKSFNPETLDAEVYNEKAEELGIVLEQRSNSEDAVAALPGGGSGDGDGNEVVDGGDNGSGDGDGNEVVDGGDNGSGDGDGNEVVDGGDNGSGDGDGNEVVDGGGDGDGGGDNGSEPPAGYVAHSQSTIQSTPKPVDILWVIDSSGSMQEEQNYLSNNFNSLVSALVDGGSEFQTAITTTDICSPDGQASAQCPIEYGGNLDSRLQGSFVGDAGSTILSSTDSNIVSKFSEYTKVGTSGSGFEHGLEAAKMAVEKSVSGSNEQLVRDGAFLSIIVVSDEEDDGIGLGMTDAYSDKNLVADGLTDHRFDHNDLIGYLNGVKGEGNFAISTVTGTRGTDGSLCTSPHSEPREEGTQYINAATATGGAIQSICETDWSTSLGFIGQDITAQITQIALDKVPYSPTIRVKVNGVETSNWSYIEANNSVKFDSEHIPDAGATIAIDYFAAP